MASASFVEIIAHFAGYLQIFQDIARDRIEYDEILSPHRSDDYTTLRPNYDHPFTPDDLDTEAGPAPAPIPGDPHNFAPLPPSRVQMGPPGGPRPRPHPGTIRIISPASIL